MISLKTTRCELRPFQAEDLQALHALWIRPGMRKYLWDDEIISLEVTQEILEQSIENLAQGKYGLWAIHLSGQDESLAGFCGFWPFHEPPQVELLYGLDEAHWGNGYATEVAKAMIPIGRELFNLDSIIASTDKPNQASIDVLSRLGMRQVRFDEETGTCHFELEV